MAAMTVLSPPGAWPRVSGSRWMSRTQRRVLIRGFSYWGTVCKQTGGHRKAW